MASLTTTPVFYQFTNNGDGTYTITFAMNDAGGVNRGYRQLVIHADGTTWMNGVATRLSLTAPQMTTLGNVVSALGAHLTACDSAGKIVF